MDEEGNVLAGQDDLKSLIHRCWRWTEIVLERYVLGYQRDDRTSTDSNTERAKLMNGSENNTNDCWKSATNWIVCL